MSIRRKTLVIISLTLLSLIFALYVASRAILLKGFEHLEYQAVEQNVQRVINALNEKLNIMASTNADWAHWDQTYSFIQGENETFVEDNLTVDTFLILELNVIVLLDSTGIVFHSQAVNLDTQKDIPVPAGLYAYLQPNSPLLRHTADANSQVTGIILLDQKPMLISSRAILNNQREGPVQGTMVIGRYLDEEVIQAMAARLAMSVTMHPADDPDLPQAFGDAKIAFMEDVESTLVRAVNTQVIAGYAVTTDFEGKPVVIWRVEMPRDILAQGEASLQYFLGALILLSIIFVLLVLSLLERLVLSRIVMLDALVSDIQDSTDLTQRINLPGKDELTNFGAAMNKMLETLDSTQTALREVLAFKSQVLANVSHDARTPISIIALRAEMIQSGMFGPITDVQNEMLESILAGTRQLMFFINNLLDAAQLERGKLELRCRDFNPSELMKTIEASMSSMAKKKNLDLIVEVGDVVPENLYADPERLTQILFNLVGNAIKFTDEGHVRATFQMPDPNHWVIQVTDTGPGIAKDDQLRLFEAFYQADGSTTRKHSHGVGLGLSIVKQLVDLMEGQITVDSQLGVGSTFTVTLPFKQKLESPG